MLTKYMSNNFISRRDDYPVSSTSGLVGRGGDHQVLRVKEDDTKYEITLDVQNFKPDELKVKLM